MYLYNARRINVRRSWELAKRIHADVVAERDALLEQLYWTQDQLRDLTVELRGLKALVLARQHAEAELAALYRERVIQRAKAAERDPNARLN
jgi:hypothetical protein